MHEQLQEFIEWWHERSTFVNTHVIAHTKAHKMLPQRQAAN